MERSQAMSTFRPVCTPLAAIVAIALLGSVSVASAQTTTAPPQVPVPAQSATPPAPSTIPQQGTMPPQNPTPAQPSVPPQGTIPPQGAGGMYPGTQSSASYPMANGKGTVTVVAGMPAATQNAGPPPPFASLDADHNGRIDESEATAYPPLDSDFLYASGGAKSISRAQYRRWASQSGH
jgi:hypothetical protein